MGALDRNALFSRASAPTFHGKLLPPRSHSCRLAKPFDLPPKPFNLQFRLSELGCVDRCPKLGQGVRIGTNSRLGGEK